MTRIPRLQPRFSLALTYPVLLLHKARINSVEAMYTFLHTRTAPEDTPWISHCQGYCAPPPRLYLLRPGSILFAAPHPPGVKNETNNFRASSFRLYHRELGKAIEEIVVSVEPFTPSLCVRRTENFAETSN